MARGRWAEQQPSKTRAEADGCRRGRVSAAKARDGKKSKTKACKRKRSGSPQKRTKARAKRQKTSVAVVSKPGNEQNEALVMPTKMEVMGFEPVTATFAGRTSRASEPL